ncbi:ATP-binding cassette domain-containing protein [Desulforhabdus sp. TSK]|uniref:ATP-binding cassette domain-containing protein n=1 Tax=Desulforhabdus sp. TSK TaxID=2925014 RepID=UPI001FC7FE5E|nr:ATP-binding cassette domain-containing protein [Desulforhabdus sp. TSK]GKT08717.1 heme ABC transporter ATPase [Desulforhabdus sp. TSK]
MALLSMRDVSIGYGGPPVLENLSLQIERGDRVCLLGRNGAGKSTLMRVIQGTLVPDRGEIIRQAGLRVAYLPQEVPQGLEGRAFDVVAGGVTPGPGEDPATREAVSEESLSSPPFHAEEEWRVQQQVAQVLSRMHLDPEAPFEALSAGLKRRVLLARGLARDPDILLLDEPTNHLDIDAITWLEDFLLRYGGTLLFVTHDRMFLRKLATRIIELERGSLVDWSCDYDTFLQRKEEVLNAEAGQWNRFDKKLAQEEIWIRQGIKARRTRNEGRVRALENMREIRRERRERTGNVRMVVQDAERSGKLVVDAEGVSFSYRDHPILRDFATTVMRGDKVGIIGPNGVGKTTLLRILVGEIPPDAGRLRLGSRLEVAYFDQLRAQLDESKSVQDNVADGNDTIIFNGSSRHVIGYLQDFLFSPERSRSPVSVLSGGERNRLLLARLFAKPSNVLILDEPTNDLDAETLELLEELLMDYPGTLFLVSHDRAFLNNVVTSTLVFEGEGRVVEYVGGYDDWLMQRRPDAVEKKTRPGGKQEQQRTRPERPRKLTFKEQRELEALPQQIESLEAEQQGLYDAMADPEFYKGEAHAIVEAKARLEALGQELKEAYQRWEALEAING